MLVVLSPAKSLDFESALPSAAVSRISGEPVLLEHSGRLIRRLQELDPEDLSELMNISAELAELNVRRFANWKAPFTPDNARPALYAFTGDVYQGLDVPSLKARDLDFAQKHLRILSGLYGVLRPLDLMQAYRLEMGTRLQTGDARTLYAFWGDRITTLLNDELQAQKSRLIVNLASVEYFKAVKEKTLKADVISPVFKDYKNGQYKIISFFAKKARGAMAGYLIRNRIDDADGLRGFDVDGYRYSEADSSEHAPVFLRKTG